MPQHPVFKESETTLMRIVVNATSKPHGAKSLNDCLYTGPSLSTKLHDILVQFRKGKFTVLAGISKAFHQVRVAPEVRKYLKFLWTDDECHE